MMSIMKEIIQEEKLLHLCLWVSLRINDENDPVRATADEMIIAYILDTLAEEGVFEFSDEDINSRFGELRAGYLLTQQVLDGNLEADLDGEEVRYRLTDQGKKRADQLEDE
jgi:hypothetical protein